MAESGEELRESELKKKAYFRMQKAYIIIAIVLMGAGLIIVALPDSGPRLFSLSSDHGPSLQDMVGLMLIILPYILIVVLAWKKKEKLIQYQNTLIFKMGVVFYGLGLGLVIASVSNDYGNWWILGALIMVVVQIPIFYTTLK